MIKYKIAAAVVATMIISGARQPVQAYGRDYRDKDFKKAQTLYGHNMFGEAKLLFEGVAEKSENPLAEGYALLCSISLMEEDYPDRMNRYISDFPYSGLVPQIRYRHALNLFDTEDYAGASEAFALAGEKNIGKKDRTEFLLSLIHI